MIRSSTWWKDSPPDPISVTYRRRFWLQLGRVFPIKFDRETKTLLVWWLLTINFERRQIWLFDGRISLDWERKNLWIGDRVLVLKTWEEYHRDRSAVEWGDVAFQVTFKKEPKRNFGVVEVQQELTARRKTFFAWQEQVLAGRVDKK